MSSQPLSDQQTQWIAESAAEAKVPRPDWSAIYSSLGCAHTIDRDNQLVAVTRETLRCARVALEAMNGIVASPNDLAAEQEIAAALASAPALERS